MVLVDACQCVTLTVKHFHCFGERRELIFQAFDITSDHIKKSNKNTFFVQARSVIVWRFTWVGVENRQEGDVIATLLKLGHHSMRH
jgi:hypothetical protein